MLSPLPRSSRPSSSPPVRGGRALPLWPAGRCEMGVNRAITLSSEDDQSPNRVFYSSKVVDDLTGFRASQTRSGAISLTGIGDFVRSLRRGGELTGTNLRKLKKRRGCSRVGCKNFPRSALRTAGKRVSLGVGSVSVTGH